MFILETERLRLRDMRLDDEAAFVAITQDERVTVHRQRLDNYVLRHLLAEKSGCLVLKAFRRNILLGCSGNPHRVSPVNPVSVNSYDERYQRFYSKEDGLFIMVTRHPQLGLRAAHPIPRMVRPISRPAPHSDDPHRKMIC